MNEPVFVPVTSNIKLGNDVNPPKKEVVDPDRTMVIPVSSSAVVFRKPGSEISAPASKKGSFLSFIQKANIRTQPQNETGSSASLEKSAGVPSTSLGSGVAAKRVVSDEVKGMIEADSKAFADLARKKQAEEAKKSGMDPWDEAILLGKYPGGRTPIEINIPGVKKESDKDRITAEQAAAAFSVPSKPKEQPLAEAKAPPVRIFDPGTIQLRRFNIKQPVVIEAPANIPVPKPAEKATPEGVVTPDNVIIPAKPKTVSDSPTAVRYDGLIAKNIIPRKPVKTQVFEIK